MKLRGRGKIIAAKLALETKNREKNVWKRLCGFDSEDIIENVDRRWTDGKTRGKRHSND
jgi:hypothetical protein